MEFFSLRVRKSGETSKMLNENFRKFYCTLLGIKAENEETLSHLERDYPSVTH